MRIGILGGTFNPIHNGHLLLGELVREKESLDTIIFLPTGNAPHKANIAPSVMRYEMVSIATEDNDNFVVLDIETNREGYSFTIDSIKIIENMYPNAELFFIIGLDTLFTLQTWRSFDEIVKRTSFLVAPRMSYHDVDVADIKLQTEYLENEYDAHIKIVKTNLFDLSSTEVRYRIKNNLSTKYMIPEGVSKYIESKRLYK